MKRLAVVWMAILLMLGAPALAQTDTPTPTPTDTPTPTPSGEPWVFATLHPASPGDAGQTTRFDYVVTVSDLHIANLLTAILFSIWAIGLLAFVVYMRSR